MADAIKYITVTSGPKTDKNKVALYERHPDHPHTEEFPDGGECFIANDIPRLVAPTPDVLQALRDMRIVEVKASDAASSKMPAPIDPENPDKDISISKATSPSGQESTGAAPDEDLKQP